MKIFKILFSFSAFLIFSLSFTLSAVADQEVDEVESVEVAAELSDDEDSEDEDVTDVGRVTVTGSRIKRIDIEGATPITVITRADIDQAGYGTVYEAVSNLTQNIGETFGENFQAGFTPANQVVDLRDFGPGRTLVLVNGKRMADYPFPYNGRSASFNWASIPLAAVERLEVLTAGASSIYGSDAIAGVINVVLVEGVEETSVRVNAGRYLDASDGGGQDYGIEFTTGGVFNKFTYTIAAEVTHLDPLFTTDRDDYDNYDDEKGAGPGEGFPWDSVRTYGAFDPFGFVGYTGYRYWGPSQFLNSSGENAGFTCDTATNVDGDYEATIGDFSPTSSRADQSLCFMGNGNPPQTIWNERDNASVFFSGAYTLNESAELYIKAMQFNTETTGVYWNSFFYPFSGGAAGATTRWSAGYSAYGPEGASLPHPYNPGELVWVQDIYSYKKYQEPTWDSSYEETSDTIDLGIRGVLNNGWEYDISHTTNDYVSESAGTLWLDIEMTDLYFNIGGVDGLGNPCVMDVYELVDMGYWDGVPGSASDPYYGYYLSGYYGQPTCMNWEFALGGVDFPYQDYQGTNDERAESYSDFTTASLVGEFGMLGGGPIGFAAVVEYQDMGYDTFPSQAVVDGLLWGTGYVQSGGSRDRQAAGVEFRLPLTSEFTVNVSGRNDVYDDAVVDVDRNTFGASFEYRPNEDFLLRGSWSESFRAPDMQRSFIDSVEGFTSGIDYYQCWLVTGGIEDCNEFSKINIKSIETGNLALRDESGDSFSLGMVWEPVDRLTLTLDVYKIVLKDIVATSSEFDLRYGEAVCRAIEAGSPLPNTPAFDTAYCNDIYSNIVREGRPVGVQPDDPNAIPSISELYTRPLNIASQEYQGADYSLRYTLITDQAGDFGFTFRGSSQLALKQAQERGASRIDYMDSSYTPRSRQVATTSWSLGDWSASLSISRIGHVNYLEDTKGSPYFNTNITAYYEIADDMFVGVTANNIFDAFPDRDAAYGGSSYYPFFVNANLYPITGPAVSAVFSARF
jgi:outer membrane receptor protein involved in Fe transport